MLVTLMDRDKLIQENIAFGHKSVTVIVLSLSDYSLPTRPWFNLF